MSEAVLPRLKTKRKWPNDWLIFYRLYGLGALNQLAYTTVQLFKGEFLMVFPTAIWIYLYLFARRRYRFYQMAEEFNMPMPRVPKLLWTVLAFMAASSIASWLAFP